MRARWSCQQQRSAAPADDSTRAALRRRLQLASDLELRQFWRRCGLRLDATRASNALHVLTALEAAGVSPEAVKRHPSLLSIRQGQLRAAAVRFTVNVLDDFVLSVLVWCVLSVAPMILLVRTEQHVSLLRPVRNK